MAVFRIKSKKIILRKITDNDIDDVFSYRSLDAVAQYQYWEPFTKEQTLNFIDKYKNCNLSNQNEWIGLVIENQNGKVIGDCAMKIHENKLSLGCNIAPQYQRQGFAKEVLMLLINYCVENYNIDEIYGITDSKNKASIKLMESLGMKKAAYEEEVWCKGERCIELKYYFNKTIR